MRTAPAFILLPTLALLWSATPTFPADGEKADLAIVGGTLIDCTGAPPRKGATILIRDGRILRVDEDGSTPLPSGTETLDATGKYLIPGLADMHVHFGLGLPMPRRPDETETVLARQLYYGVTAILQLGATDGSAASIRSLQERRAAGTLAAPHIYGTGGHLTLPGSHPIYTLFPEHVRRAADELIASTPVDEPVDLYALGIGLSFVRTEAAARQAVRERAAGGVDAIKITVESGPTSFGDDHPQMPVDMIAAITDEARRGGLPVYAHVSSRDELEASIEGGVAGTVHAARNLPLPDAALAESMAARGHRLVPTLSLYTPPVDLDDPFLRQTVTEEEVAALSRPEFLRRVGARWECCAPFDDLLANIGMMHNQGVPIAVGSDTGNPFIFAGYSVHRELELLVRAGLSPMDALQAATLRAAQMIGAESDFGTIQAGLRADLLVLGADPMADIRNTRTLELVVLDGVVIDRSSLLP